MMTLGPRSFGVVVSVVMAEVDFDDNDAGFELLDEDSSPSRADLLPRSFLFVFFDLAAAGMIRFL